jgi:uncharacterized protein DUF1629
MAPITSKVFFEVHADHTQFPGKWFLDEPFTATGEEIDAREFTEGLPYHGPSPARLPIANPGKEVAFLLVAFAMPVVSQAVAATVSRIAPAEVELFPIEVVGSKDSYVILNSICRLDCLDEGRSELTRWEEGGHRPDRIGQIHVISVIRIDPARALNHHIFRIRDWPLALLISGTLKDALETIPNLGVVFEPVV